jgi:hypothetical protein
MDIRPPPDVEVMWGWCPWLQMKIQRMLMKVGNNARPNDFASAIPQQI